MYNRYIPQADGSYHRRQYPDHVPGKAHAPIREKEAPDEELPDCKQEPKRQEFGSPRCQHCSHKKMPNPCGQESSLQGIGSFLSQLLPKDFDTADLMVILLLLLMSGDCQEDQTNALLTLALYLFL